MGRLPFLLGASSAAPLGPYAAGGVGLPPCPSSSALCAPPVGAPRPRPCASSASLRFACGASAPAPPRRALPRMPLGCLGGGWVARSARALPRPARLPLALGLRALLSRLVFPRSRGKTLKWLFLFSGSVFPCCGWWSGLGGFAPTFSSLSRVAFGPPSPCRSPRYGGPCPMTLCFAWSFVSGGFEPPIAKPRGKNTAVVPNRPPRRAYRARARCFGVRAFLLAVGICAYRLLIVLSPPPLPPPVGRGSAARFARSPAASARCASLAVSLSPRRLGARYARARLDGRALAPLVRGPRPMLLTRSGLLLA